MWHVRGMGEVHTGFFFGGGDLSEGDLLENLALDGGIILKWIFKNWGGESATGLIWLRDRWRPLVYAVMNLWVS